MSHHGDVAQHNDTVALTHLTEGLACHLPRNLSKPTSSPTVQSRRERRTPIWSILGGTRIQDRWLYADGRRRIGFQDSTVGHAARVVHEYWL